MISTFMPWKQVRASLSFFIITSLAIILGSIYFSVAPLYLNTVEKAAFANSLQDLGNNLHPQVVTSFAPLSENAYKEDRDIISSIAQNSFKGSFISNEVYATTPRSSATMLRRPSVDSVAFFQFLSGYDEYITIVDGTLPTHDQAYSSDSPIGPSEIKIAIGELAADKLDIGVGDIIEISAFSGRNYPTITANVTAIIAPRDINELYWAGQGTEYFDTQLAGDRWLLRLFVDQNTFFMLGENFSLLGTTKDIIYLDQLELIEFGVDETQNIVTNFSTDLSESFPSGDLFLGIQGNVENFQRQLTKSSIPLTIVFSLSSIVSLYIFFMLGLILKDVYLNQIILLRSRGANLRNITTNVFASIFVIMILGLILAPMISYSIIKILSVSPVWANSAGLDSVTDLKILSIYPWVVGGLILSLLFIVFPTLMTMKSEEIIVDSADQYRPKPFWWQKYFIDAWFLILAGIILFQFWGSKSGEGQGAIDNARTFSDFENIILLMPIVVVLVILFGFYRFFPIVASLMAYFISKTNLLSTKLAIDRIARFPADALLLGGLVLLVSSVGAFLASFGGTLERSQEEAAYFSTGGDAKISRPGGFDLMSFSDLDIVFSAEEGIDRATAAYRSVGGIGSIQVGTLVPLLGVDVETIGDTLVTNSVQIDDLNEGINKLAFASSSSVAPRLIEMGSTSISVWVKPEYGKGNRFLWLHIMDSDGASHIYSMGPLNFFDWKKLTVDLAKGNQPAPPGPYKLKSILIFENAFGSGGSPGSILIDDLTAANAETESLEVDNFDIARDWLPVLVTGTRSDSVTGVIDSNRGEVLRFEWGKQTAQGLRGIYVTPKFDRVPALAHDRFLSLKGIEVGDVTSIYISGRLVPIRIVGEIDKFPTLNPNPVGFLVMDGESLLDHLNVTNIGPYVWPNEIMLRFSEQNETIDLVSYLSDKPELTGTIIDKSTIMESSDKNPLEAAGWKGAALLATGYTLLLLGLGIGSYLLYTIKKSTREIAILKALGLGVVANNSSLSLGYFSTVAMSLPLGLATGLFLSQILVPRFNNLSVKGASPYYSLNVDLSLLLIFCSVIIASVIVFVVSVLVAQNRLSIATIIRSDNEG